MDLGSTAFCSFHARGVRQPTFCNSHSLRCSHVWFGHVCSCQPRAVEENIGSSQLLLTILHQMFLTNLQLHWWNEILRQDVCCGDGKTCSQHLLCRLVKFSARNLFQLYTKFFHGRWWAEVQKVSQRSVFMKGCGLKSIKRLDLLSSKQVNWKFDSMKYKNILKCCIKKINSSGYWCC